MKLAHRIKHFLGFHGKDSDNEWLDGRIFIDYAQRKYCCRTCGRGYAVIEPLPDQWNKKEADRLRKQRDKDFADLKAYLEKTR